MEKKTTTVSVRIDDDRVEKIEAMMQSHEMSKTDVIQYAIDTFYHTRGWSPGNIVKIPLSNDTMTRAKRLHYTYGFKDSFEKLISEAVDRGLNLLYDEFNKGGDLDDAAVEVFKRKEAIKLEMDSISE